RLEPEGVHLRAAHQVLGAREEHQAVDVAGAGPGGVPGVGGVGGDQRVGAAAAVDGQRGDLRVAVNPRRRQGGDDVARPGAVPPGGVAAVVHGQGDGPGAVNVHEALDGPDVSAGGPRRQADDHGVGAAAVGHVQGAGGPGDEHLVVAAAGVQEGGV